ncbi:exosortase H [Candidatus Venteria ishoeyi]|uniref:Transmembrane exosortase (Exosortase_EpsH) n=1 Tax=Candidatus Venteria ishoeyi TaxID=1899563 RepID=A0A1H6FCE8_9GAMM|nr:exosortase H [Candidatus Venteria ishoeyi]SEH06826.1 Uncharacterised protein [Candidatus Venteria ishoeyi]
MGLFFLRFLLILVVLFVLEMSMPVQQMLILPWTTQLAALCGTLVHYFDPGVLVTGAEIRSSDRSFAVVIRSGCNGVEALIILIAALFAFPASNTYRVTGLLIGALAVQGLNIIRIISLFYLGQWSLSAFQWAHLYAWEVLIMLDVLIVFMLWLRALPIPKNHEPVVAT